MADERRTEGEPHDRLTRLCAAMTETLDAHPEHGEEKCIVFLQDGERGGMVLHGYEDDTEAMADLLFHLKALFKANGKEMLLMPIGRG